MAEGREDDLRRRSPLNNERHHRALLSQQLPQHHHLQNARSTSHQSQNVVADGGYNQVENLHQQALGVQDSITNAHTGQQLLSHSTSDKVFNIRSSVSASSSCNNPISAPHQIDDTAVHAASPTSNSQVPLYFTHNGDNLKNGQNYTWHHSSSTGITSNNENIKVSIQQKDSHNNNSIREPQLHQNPQVSFMKGSHELASAENQQYSLQCHPNFHDNDKNSNRNIMETHIHVGNDNLSTGNVSKHGEQKNNKASQIPGLKVERIQLQITWTSIEEIRKKIFSFVNDFKNYIDNDPKTRPKSSPLLRSIQNTEENSKFAIISSWLNNQESLSEISLLESIESELKLLLNLNSSAFQVLEDTHTSISDSSKIKAEILTNEKLLKARINILQEHKRNIINEDATEVYIANNNLSDISTRKRQSSSLSGSVGKRQKKNPNQKFLGVSTKCDTGDKKDLKQNELEGKRNQVVKIRDEFPDRITNLLLEMPCFQSAPRGFLSSNSQNTESVPHGAELWKIMPLYFPIPDTFSLSYIGRILGFDAALANDTIEKDDNNDVDKSSILLEECKNDKWKQVPRLGDFSTYIQLQKVGRMSDLNLPLDEVDPMWKAIMNQYRGFRDDLYKPSADISKSNIITLDCISFAKRLKMINDHIKFRPANLEDVISLIKFKSVNKGTHDNFEHAIKCGSQFILIAESDSSGMIGFIHYRFCWFRQKLRNPSSNVNGIQNNAGLIPASKTGLAKSHAERILYIQNVQCNEGLNGNIDCLTPLVLISLAIEHARQYAVYGVMDTPQESVSFFQHYFRMHVISSDGSNPQGNSIAFLAIDLEGCNYRYAYLKKYHEINFAEQTTIDPVQDKSERILVSLPTVQDFFRCGVLNKPLSHDSFTYMYDHAINFVSKEKNHHNVEITVKVNRSVDTIEKRMSAHPSVSIPHNDLENKGVADWEILRLFPKKSTQQNIESCKQKESSVALELEHLKIQLSMSENNFLPTLWSLYKKCYDERRLFELTSPLRSKTKSALKQYQMLLERYREEQKSWEKQQEQEENAVCDVCHDGESTGENRIIFCDSCNVSVHQHCYGIEKVPKGDYFCHACLFINRDESETIKDNGSQQQCDKKQILPICCEVCPRRQGAFIETRIITKTGNITKAPKWIHMVCAKWHGFRFVDRSTGEPVAFGNIVEDVTELKNHFRSNDTQCCLCLGMRGCYIKCRVENCDKWMHVTCARSSGQCNVNHGSNHLGTVESEDSWSLSCPKHSILDDLDIIPAGTKHLQELAKKFPLEPKPVPPPKAFYKMTKKEREVHFANPEWEEEIMEVIMKKGSSSRCEVCFQPNNYPTDLNATGLMRCHICDASAHVHCITQEWKIEKFQNKGPKVTCMRCLYIEMHKEDDNYFEPKCHMCNDKNGALIKAHAAPVSMRKWKANPSAFKKSLFGRQIWCHPICGMWHPKCSVMEDGSINCSYIVMANGSTHIESQHVCNLCGRSDKVKLQCDHNVQNNEKPCPFRFHPTCARQAGLQVSDVEHDGEVEFSVKCFHHSQCQYALRAVLEDMIEVEKSKTHNGLMSFECAASIFSWGVIAINCLSWAWKWSEWWVLSGDTWEPLLEDGQREQDMTKEELKIVESTPDTRCLDARKCRLAAFGAALRNRDYDKDDGDDRQVLEKALRSVLSIPSLVGPWRKNEIDFFVGWLARVYRSKAPQLGLGDNKIPVNEVLSIESSNHFHDNSPKYVLGKRPLPGKQIFKKDQIFETNIQEVDDYCDEEIPLSRFLSPERMHINNSRKSTGIATVCKQESSSPKRQARK